LLQLLLTYWPVLLLLYVPRLAQVVAVTVARRIQARLDRAIPDDLPMTAGEWLERRVRAMQLGVSAVVTDQHADAYRWTDKLIHLRDTTHFKADPIYWAIAAHELGHARNRTLTPVLGNLRNLCHGMSAPLIALGIASLVGYVLYAIPLASHLAFACFVVASALHVFVLVDEAAASIYAYRELRANRDITVTHRRAIRSILIAYFATYLVTYASYALLLTQWPLLATLAVPSASAELTTIGWMFAAILSVASVVAWWLPSAVRWIPITLLVLLVWNVVDPAYTWCVIAALVASFRVWHFMAHVPFLLPFAFVELFVTKLEGPGIDRTREFLHLRARGEKVIEAGNRRIEAAQAYWKAHPMLVNRIWSFVWIGYLPLLVAIWL
jgi:Zn-dependent membrane protease YugP